MAESFKGLVKVTRNSGSPTTVEIQGNDGTLFLGGREQDGDLTIRGKGTDKTDGKIRFNFSGGEAHLQIRDKDGRTPRFSFSGNTGDLTIRDKAGKNRFSFSGDTGNLEILNKEGKSRFSFSGDKAEFVVTAPNGTTNVVQIDGAGNLTLDGDVILRHAGAAEDFELADGQNPPPGSVMVLTDNGRLRAATQPHDRRVVGVLSGAKDARPGLVLGRRSGGLPITLVGTTFCLADATNAPIRVGDLLTTSATPGHAMKATDTTRALGATIGKALRPLDRGKDLVLILVTLQ